MIPYQLITTQAELLTFCQYAQRFPYLALDTEFVRTRTYYAKLGLVQVRVHDQLVLIDPLAEIDLTPFWQLLKDPQLILVIHAGGEDYEILMQQMGEMPTAVVDTQIAAAFAGHGDALGYAALVQHYTNIEIDKSQSRTDWLQRPLQPVQLDYAAADVQYLYDIYPQLLAELSAEKLALVKAETIEQVRRRAESIPPQWLYLFFGNAWQCNRQQLAVLRELLQWRLQRAQQSNIPLGFVAKDHIVLELARRCPSNVLQLRGITELSPVTIRYSGESLLEAIQRGLACTDLPEPLTRLTDLTDYKATYKQIQEQVQQLARDLDISPGLVASRRQINDVIHWEWQVPAVAKAELIAPDLYRGWRGAKLKPFITELLQRDR